LRHNQAFIRNERYVSGTVYLGLGGDGSEQIEA
jgi:hypothetical protein